MPIFVSHLINNYFQILVISYEIHFEGKIIVTIQLLQKSIESLNKYIMRTHYL